MDRGCDVTVSQFETIADGYGGGLGGESGLVESAVEKISGAVAGEHATGPIGAVGARSQANQQYFSVERTKGGHRFSPVVAVLVGFALYLCDSYAVFAKPGAAVAGSDRRLEAGQGLLR
jgi:hypothetical protein